MLNPEDAIDNKFMNIIAYTDGSAVLKYPFLGGFGVYIKTKTKTYKISKGFFNTKTGRMELTAVIYCLKSIQNKNARITIYSDSMYVVNTCNEWIENWDRIGFVGKKNIDLLKQLLYELRLFAKKPVLIHIKGHQDVIDKHTEGNNIVDRLADYKRHKRYEQDASFDDLTTFEKDDFYEYEGKLYYEPERLLKQEFDEYKTKTNELLRQTNKDI